MVPAILKAAPDSKVGGHLGMFKSRERILERYFWPGLSNDVQEYVEACRECARVKPWSKPARVPMKPILLAAAPNHRIHFFFGRGLTSGDERACPKEAKASL